MGGKGEKRREKNYLAADGRTGETPFKLCNNQNVKPGSDFEQRNGEGYITSSDQENDVTLNKGDEKRKMNQINETIFVSNRSLRSFGWSVQKERTQE